MPVRNDPDARLEEMKSEFLEQCADLWTQHEERFMRYKAESETGKINLTFKATLDFSEGKAGLETTIGYSQVVKDKRRAEFDSPDQEQIPGTSREELNGNVILIDKEA